MSHFMPRLETYLHNPANRMKRRRAMFSTPPGGKETKPMKTTFAKFAFMMLFAALGTGCHGHCKWGDDAATARADLEHRVGKLMKVARATETQHAQLGPIIERIAPDVHQTARAHNELTASLAAEWTKPAPDRAKIELLAETLVDSLRRCAKSAVAALFDVHGVLTPEQRAGVLAHFMEHHD
jgi:periplasmic protein CpxP/Spy